MTTPNSASPGFKVPFNIPGAPEHVTLSELVDEAKPLLQNSLDSWQRKPGAFETALSQASWWHFWLLVTISEIANALAFAIATRGGVLRLLFAFVVSIPIGLIVFYLGSYASHWYATKQAGGSATLVQHSYVLGVIWAGGLIIVSLITLVLGILGLGGIAALLSLVVEIYALYLMGDSIGRLYQFQDRNQVWITAAVMVIVNIVAAIILSGILVSGIVFAIIR